MILDARLGVKRFALGCLPAAATLAPAAIPVLTRLPAPRQCLLPIAHRPQPPARDRRAGKALTTKQQGSIIRAIDSSCGGRESPTAA